MISEKSGKSRTVQIVEADFKYPHLRIEKWRSMGDKNDPTFEPPEQIAVADHAVVSPRKGVSIPDLKEAMTDRGWIVRSETRYFLLVEVPDFDRIEALPAFIDQLKEIQQVQIAEPDYVVHHMEVFPNEITNGKIRLWGMHNIGGVSGLIDSDIDAPAAWGIRHNAAPVIVGITDTGLHTTHTDLSANVWRNPGEVADGLDSDGNGIIDDLYGVDVVTESGDLVDENGHGTHVSGTIGAQGNNNKGVVGVAWDVQLMGARFLGPVGYGTNSDAIKAIDYCVDNGASIINASWGGGGLSLILKDALNRANQAGVVFVAAAGNNGMDNDQIQVYPAAYRLPNVLAVAATNARDEMAGFSNYGQSRVHLGAPGVSIYSTYHDPVWYTGDDGYAPLSGTSMAAPHVSGVAALLRAEFSSEDHHQLINRILTSVDPLESLAERVQTGGRLNAHKALSASRSSPLNDDQNQAIVWSGARGTWTGSLKHSSIETGESTQHGVGSVWFRWEPTYQGIGQIHVESHDGEIGVILYRERQGGLTIVSQDRGAATIDLSVAVSPDERYLLALFHEGSASAHVDLDVFLPAGNDNFRDASRVEGEAFELYSSNIGSSFEFGEPDHAGVGWGNSIWFRWTAPSTGDYVFSTYGSRFDTVMAVYTGDEITDLTEVVSNDDRSQNDLSSKVRFTAVEGTSYFIAVDSYWDTEGDVRLTGNRYGEIVILGQPRSVEAVAGRPVSFSVMAQGPGYLTYQWFYNGNPLPGSHRAVYTIPAVSGKDLGQYHVVVSNREDAVASATVELSFRSTGAEILWEMNDLDVVSGNEQELYVLVTGTGPFTYQWYQDGALIEGATDSRYRIPYMTSEYEGNYFVEITGPRDTVRSSTFHVRYIDTPWDHWRWRNPIPGKHTLKDVGFYAGEFFAVGDGGTIARSLDGEYWRTESLRDLMSWMDQVAYGNGTYVIGGRQGAFVYSTDGKNWTLHNIGESSSIVDLNYANGKFYMRTSYRTILASTDGLSWFVPNQLNPYKFTRMCIGDDRVLAVDDTGTVHVSEDGDLWTSHAPEFQIDRIYSYDGTFHAWDKITNSLFKLYTSSDGITWSGPVDSTVDWTSGSHRQIEVDGALYGLLFNQDVYYSPDGINRHVYQIQNSQNLDFHRIAFGKGRFVVVGEDGVIVSGEKLDQLTLKGTRYTESLYSLFNVNDEMAAFSYGQKPSFLSSGDGVFWKRERMHYDTGEYFYNIPHDIVFDGIRYWGACGANGLKAGYDYRELRSLATVPGGACSAVAYENGKLFATFSDGTYVSTDGGGTWTVVPTPHPGTQLKFANGVFVGIKNRNVYTSPDGINWTVHMPTPSNYSDFTHLTHTGSEFVIYRKDGGLLRSSNGFSWSVTSTGVSNAAGLASDGTHYFLLTSDSVWFSNTLSTWHQSKLPSSGAYDLAVYNGTVLVAGRDGMLLQAGTPNALAPDGKLTSLSNRLSFSLGDRLSIFGEAWDPEEDLEHIEVRVNGVLQGTFPGPEYGIQWQPSGAGEHVVVARARDTSGLVRSTSSSVMVETGKTTQPVLKTAADFAKYDITVFGDHLYAIDQSGSVLRSVDGKDWEALVAPGQSAISIVAGEDRLVVFDHYGKIATTEDGVSWVRQTLPVGDSRFFGNVVFRNDRFIAVYDEYLASSEDGMVWQVSRPFGNQIRVRSVAFANGVYVAISQTSSANKVSVSTDNETWTQILRESLYNYQDVEHGDAGFVLVTSGGIIFHSVDGYNWQEAADLAAGIGDVHFAGGHYFLGSRVSDSTGGYKMLFMSRDAHTWNTVQHAGNYDDIAYGNGVYLSIAKYHLRRSVDGIHWEEISGLPFGYNWSIAFNSEGFYGAAQSGSSFLSPDGESFTFFAVSSSTSSQYWTDLVEFNGILVASGNKGKIYASTNGTSWIPVAEGLTSSSQTYKLAKGGGCLVAYSSFGAVWSDDGIQWHPTVSPVVLRLDTVEYANGRFIGFAYKDLWFSENGKDWLLDNSAVNAPISVSSMAYGNNTHVTAGNYGNHIRRSVDGSTWTEPSDIPDVSASSKGYYVTFGHGMFIVSGHFGRILTSTDGDSWTMNQQDSGIHFNFVTAVSGGFLALDSEGNIYRSSDTVTWDKESAYAVGANMAVEVSDGTLYLVGFGGVVQYGEVDLQAVHITGSEGALGIGDEFQVSVEINNLEGTEWNSDVPLDLDVYFSRDRFWGNADDIKIFRHTVETLTIPSGESRNMTFSFLLPDIIRGGDFYVGVRMDPENRIPEKNESNNFIFTESPKVQVPEWALDVETAGDGGVQRNSYSQRYVHGSPVLLIPVAAKGSVFTGWSGAGLSGLGDATIVMTKDVSVVAQFEQGWPLRLKTVGRGHVQTHPEAVSYTEGTDVTLEAVPAVGWTFAGWTGDLTEETSPTTVTMDSSKTITAWFTQSFADYQKTWFTESEQSLPISEEMADADGDGVLNWMEYAAGSNPRDNTDRPMKELIKTPEALYMIFTRNTGSTSKVVCTQSSDLNHWAREGVEERVLHESDGVERVEARLRVSETPVGFLRLEFHK